MAQKIRVMRVSRRQLVTLAVTLAAFGMSGCASHGYRNEEVDDTIEIVDLGSGERVSLPYIARNACRDRLALVDDTRERFYMFRRQGRNTTLRTISYAGVVLEEMELVGAIAGDLSDDARYIASPVHPRGGVKIHEIATGSSHVVLPELEAKVSILGWISDDVILIVTYADKKESEYEGAVARLNLSDGNLEVLYTSKALGVGTVFALAPNRRLLAFYTRWSSEDIRVLDLATREVYVVTTGIHVDPSGNECFAWSPDSSLLAYESGLGAAIRVYSVTERKEVVSVSPDAVSRWLHPYWSKIDFSVGEWIHNFYFFDSRALMVETGDLGSDLGPVGIPQRQLVAADLATGAFSKPFPWKFRKHGRPIAGGTKQLCFVDDDRNDSVEWPRRPVPAPTRLRR